MGAKIKRWRRYAAIGFSAFVMALAALVTIPAAQTSAAGCNYNTEWFIGSMNGYSYTPTRWVPSWSGCKDINISNVWNQYGNTGSCIQIRVRFYPTAGGSSANNWKLFCSGWGAMVIASDVRDGTQYRIEANYGAEYVNYSVRIFD